MSAEPRIVSIDPDAAVRELHDCIVATNTCMEALASMFPDVTFLTGVVRGQPCGTLAYARSQHFDHYTPEAMNNAACLAQLITGLADELAERFRLEIAHAQRMRELMAEAKQMRILHEPEDAGKEI